jgi:hypothetical protein
MLCEEELKDESLSIPPLLPLSQPQALRPTGAAGGSDELEKLCVPGVPFCTPEASEGTGNACFALAAGSHRFGISSSSRPASPPPAPPSLHDVTPPDLPKLAGSSTVGDEFSQQAVVKVPPPTRPSSSPSSHACSEDGVFVSDADYRSRQTCSDSNDASGCDRKKRRVSSKTRRPAAQPKELKKAKKALAARKYREDKNNQMRALEDRNKELSSRVNELEQQLRTVIARQSFPSNSLTLR